MSVYFPPINQVLPTQPFNNLINAYGMRLYWLKGSTCPCMYAGPSPGSPVSNCQTCYGRGTYWNQPVGPFQGLITFIHMGPTPDEPGAIMDESQGLILNGEPSLTIPYTAGEVWQEAALMDQFVEVDSISRFNAELQVGRNTTLPYIQNVMVAASGAVTIWNSATSTIVTGVTYTVSGSQVTLTSGYADGTSYIVDFKAAPAYVAYRRAGMPAHIRPFGQQTLPRRFRLQTLDLWTRAKFATDIPSVSGIAVSGFGVSP